VPGASIAFRNIMGGRESPPGSPAKPLRGAPGNVSARSFHSLRHTFVTALARLTLPSIPATARGHASEAQNLHYTHPEFAACALPSSCRPVKRE
jgi:integrase